MDEGAPVLSIRVVAGPTPPRASLAEGDISWRIISHLSLNYLSLADSDPSRGAAALRDLLRLYAEVADATIRKQIEGIKSIQRRPITRRVATPGPIAFARGLELSVTFDEPAFEGFGIMTLGAVLDHFFARYVSLSSFTETVIRSSERGEIIRWPPRIGQRQIV
jgi:type VI secretion system protein ImpG